jgi:hypothetical protein
VEDRADTDDDSSPVSNRIYGIYGSGKCIHKDHDENETISSDGDDDDDFESDCSDPSGAARITRARASGALADNLRDAKFFPSSTSIKRVREKSNEVEEDKTPAALHQSQTSVPTADLQGTNDSPSPSIPGTSAALHQSLTSITTADLQGTNDFPSPSIPGMGTSLVSPHPLRKKRKYRNVCE